MPRTVLLLLLCSIAGLAHAQAVHRCVDASGRSVYSDQPCDSLGAVARAAPRRSTVGNVHGVTSGTGTVAAGCPRSLDSLMHGVRGALEAGDVNRLATHYHWPGTSARGARFVMDELEAIARRPLAAVQWVMPVPDLPDPADPLLAIGPGPGQPHPAPQAGDRRPVALRVDQASSANDPGARGVDFRLRRHAGCWWIEL